MTPVTKRILSAVAGGVSLSLLFLFVASIWPQSDWIYFPQLPGVFIAMSAVGVHSGTRLAHNVVMVIANSVFYGLIVFTSYPLLVRSHGSN